MLGKGCHFEPFLREISALLKEISHRTLALAGTQVLGKNAPRNDSA
jgi:hypothetical protein